MQQNYTNLQDRTSENSPLRVHYFYKKLFVVFVIFFSTVVGYSQNYSPCAVMTTNAVNQATYSGNYNPAYLNNFNSVTFRIYFWGIRTSTGQESVTQDRIQKIMKEINKAFNPFGICFVLEGFGFIEGNDALYENSVYGDVGEYARNHGYFKSNSFNCYLPYEFNGNYSGLSGTLSQSLIVRTQYDNYNDAVLPLIVAHELGHVFALYHLHGKVNSGNGVVEEHVTRDSSDPNYNALTVGDDVHDTPAMPDFWQPEFGSFDEPITGHSRTILDTTNCTFDSSQYNFTDEQGTPLQITTYDVGNYMLYGADDCKKHFTTGQGIRMLETIEGNPLAFASMKALNLVKDLYVKDSPDDYGSEPNLSTAYLWESDAIWIRQQPDGVGEHQNPVYASNNPNYVYVRIQNRGCDTISNNAELKLYWTKAGTNLSWPYSWIGNSFPNNGPLMGGVIGVVSIPELAPGEETVVNMPWIIPNPNDYLNLTDSPWHFCLLAEINSPDDPVTQLPNGSTSLNEYVSNNNNVAWKNVTVLLLVQDLPEQPTGGVIAVGNPSIYPERFDLTFSGTENQSNKIYKEAEVSIKVNQTLFDAWKRGGKVSHNVRQEGQTFLVLGDNAALKNLQFGPREIGTAYVQFNFLTEKVTSESQYTYRAIQSYVDGGDILGGETYKINRSHRALFFANPGVDKQVDKGQIITLNAVNINEPALYNWYDSNGNLIYQGASFETSINIAKKYKLEIIALADGYKDYDSIKIGLKPSRLKMLYPNPTANQLTVQYQINEGETAYLSITPQAGGNSSNNYILSVEDKQLTIDISSFPQGLYFVSLVVDGIIKDTQQILKN